MAFRIDLFILFKYHVRLIHERSRDNEYDSKSVRFVYLFVKTVTILILKEKEKQNSHCSRIAKYRRNPSVKSELLHS